MSGEVVVVSAGAAIGATALLGVAAVGGVAWVLLKQWQEEQRFLARQRCREEKDRLAAWQEFQAVQQQGMQNLSAVRQQARQQLAGLRLRRADADDAAGSGPTAPAVRAQGFLDSDERSQAGQLLQQLDSLFDAWPEALAQHAESPLPGLRSQLQHWRAQLDGPAPPLLETLQGFTDTARHRLEQFAASLEHRQQTLAQQIQATENLLDALLETRALNQDALRGEELDGLHTHLLRLLQRDTINPADLALLQGKFESLRLAVQADLDEAAVRATVKARVAHHLQSLGYVPLATSAGGDPDTWQIPGGERVRFALQPKQRLSFQVQHERDRATDAALSLAEHAFLRQQEKRWCKDLRRVIDGLNADGFDYKTQFERELPEGSIPIVVLESAAQLLEDGEEARRSTPQHRYLP